MRDNLAIMFLVFLLTIIFTFILLQKQITSLRQDVTALQNIIRADVERGKKF